jgi:hypothetical protein
MPFHHLEVYQPVFPGKLAHHACCVADCISYWGRNGPAHYDLVGVKNMRETQPFELPDGDGRGNIVGKHQVASCVMKSPALTLSLPQCAASIFSANVISLSLMRRRS